MMGNILISLIKGIQVNCQIKKWKSFFLLYSLFDDVNENEPKTKRSKYMNILLQ